ncbi:MAG: response regulator [Frankiales bacterium]|nr:response regulator [Frankiales bacterium]
MTPTLAPIGNVLGLHDLAALHRCSADGSLELLYQPEVDLATGAIVAMEGLLRWHHAEMGVLTPLSFLELAEDSGEIAAIGEWVLRQGADEAARWSGLPAPQRRLWLNVSVGQLSAPGFPDLVAAVVAAAGLPHGALGLEVSEASVRRLGAAAGPLLAELRDAGVALAVDDFSSWIATLGAIAALPVDAVKLGHRYVRGVGDHVGADGSGDRTVAAIIEQAHDHGMVVVAEGVETWGEAARLTELGCDRAHGWLYASAQRADRARWLLRSGTGWQGSCVPAARAGS